MRGWDLAEPRPSALIESLRAFGYSPEAAVADLVDNSISAGARSIAVDFYWDGAASRVSVLDDGAGMTADALVNAMRLGSTSPLDTRSREDLGRFGLGLKTASFSQARELTVLTKATEGVALRRWDLDTVGATGEWRLLRDGPPGSETLHIPTATGTLVTWSKCDRLVGAAEVGDANAQRHFNKVIARVGQHLSAVFHRFLGSRLTIRLNGNPLRAWDPFLQNHPATQVLDTEVLPLAAAEVRVKAMVLPHRSKLSRTQQEEGAGQRGWTQQQGFYLYRGDRLLVQGGWLGLDITRDEHTKLARIAVDFPSTLDQEWQVDVKKSSARAPGPIRDDLLRIARASRKRAEEVYRHRGKIVARHHAQDFVMVWQQFKSRDDEISYRLNRKHPVISSLLQTADSQIVERALRFIEETVPTTLIGMSLSAAHDQQPSPFKNSHAELLPIFEFAHEGLVRAGLSSNEAITRLAATEPFTDYPEIIQVFREKKLSDEL